VSERPRPIRERRPEIPAYLAVAIDRALSKKPEHRFADAAEFRDALASGESSLRGGRSAHHAAPAVAPAPFDPPIVPPVLPVLPVPPMAPAIPPSAPFPAPPPGLSPMELRRWYTAQRRLAISQQLQAVGPVGLAMNDRAGWPLPQTYDERPLEDRVTSFRRSVFSWVGWTTVLFGINVATHGPGPWFLFPSAFMALNVLRKGGSIWSDGVGPVEAFTKGINKRLRAERATENRQASLAGPIAAGGTPAAPRMTPEQLAAQLAPADVLAGPHGDVVRRAAVDRLLMRDIAASLGPIERSMIPDVVPTIDALADRVGSVATTLHRLDQDVSGTSLGSLDARIATMQTESDTPERERRLSLLQRQRSSLHDLLERRQTLANQLESTSLMLQNLKLDMLKLRSAGLGNEIENQSTATQEARALSREIGHVVQAAEDLRKL
jgi:serine/threonine-protein kinase